MMRKSPSPKGLDLIQDDEAAAKAINTTWSPLSVRRTVTYIQSRAVWKTGYQSLRLHKALWESDRRNKSLKACIFIT